MTIIASIGMALGLATASGTAPAVHVVSLDHASGAVQAEYRGQIAIKQKQIGTSAPAGRPSTLRCVWEANLTVDRTATTGSGNLASRSFIQDGIAKGSRAGWCSTNGAAIARDASRSMGDVSQHLAAAAQRDGDTLLSELDQIVAHPRVG